MADVFDDATKQVIPSVNTPDYPSPPWMVNPIGFRSLLRNRIPSRYWKDIGANAVAEMSAAEKRVVDQTVQSLDIASNGTLDPDGIRSVDANGVAFHTITISKKDLSKNAVPTGLEVVNIYQSIPIPGTPSQVTLVNGSVTFNLGPQAVRCQITLEAKDQAGVLLSGSLTVRFK